jgi:diguanylate cyclase
LYRNHIAEIDATVVNRVSQDFDKVMANISASTAQAADEAGQFGQALERWSSNYATGKLTPSLSHGIGDLLHHSKEMQQTVQMLNSRLEESRREVEELRKEVHRAREEAMIDGLTGLANRRSFDIALSSHFANLDAQSPGLCLLIADIDHFKEINDTYGHLFGDKVITSIAAVLRNSVKGNDLAARYGGEEFVVILPDTPIQSALVLAERIRKVIENYHIRRTGSNEVVASVTVSLGVACRCAGESEQQLIARADEALYKSKQGGRNRVTSAANAN